MRRRAVAVDQMQKQKKKRKGCRVLGQKLEKAASCAWRQLCAASVRAPTAGESSPTSAGSGFDALAGAAGCGNVAMGPRFPPVAGRVRQPETWHTKPRPSIRSTHVSAVSQQVSAETQGWPETLHLRGGRSSGIYGAVAAPALQHRLAGAAGPAPQFGGQFAGHCWQQH